MNSKGASKNYFIAVFFTVLFSQINAVENVKDAPIAEKQDLIQRCHSHNLIPLTYRDLEGDWICSAVSTGKEAASMESTIRTQTISCIVSMDNQGVGCIPQGTNTYTKKQLNKLNNIDLTNQVKIKVVITNPNEQTGVFHVITTDLIKGTDKIIEQKWNFIAIRARKTGKVDKIIGHRLDKILTTFEAVRNN